MPPRHPAHALVAFATQLLTRSGLDSSLATSVASILVEGDLLGHTTHGLALLPGYLGELEKGSMTKSGTYAVVADSPAALTWDGRRLPGPWLVEEAFKVAIERARTLGTCTVAIRRSHHIACLAAYLQPIVEQGFMAILTCSDPTVATVAPHGGRQGVFTPNPYAAAWPTSEGPVIFDVSMSIATNGLVNRAAREGRRLPGPWLVDAGGIPTDDPTVMSGELRGALLPIGGLDHGHKGFALALLVEALTGALAGHGRADPSEGWSANVFLQVLNPAHFGGAAAFVREAGHVAHACRTNPPRDGVTPVRLPGDSGLRRRADQLSNGVSLRAGILSSLQPWAEKLAVPMPSGLG